MAIGPLVFQASRLNGPCQQRNSPCFISSIGISPRTSLDSCDAWLTDGPRPVQQQWSLHRYSSALGICCTSGCESIGRACPGSLLPCLTFAADSCPRSRLLWRQSLAVMSYPSLLSLLYLWSIGHILFLGYIVLCEPGFRPFVVFPLASLACYSPYSTANENHKHLH